jgi:hypothetical protein
MQDLREAQIRYLIHFDDGGSGMRSRTEPIRVGTKFEESGSRYRIKRVEQPAHERTFGYAWVSRLDRD